MPYISRFGTGSCLVAELCPKGVFSGFLCRSPFPPALHTRCWPAFIYVELCFSLRLMPIFIWKLIVRFIVTDYKSYILYLLYVQFRYFPHKVFREKHFPSRNILSGVMPAGMYISEKLSCTTVSSSITKEGTMVQINFLFIYFNMHLHRYLFKVLRIILPEILNTMITSYKIYFPILSASVRLSLIPSTIITKFLHPNA